MRASIACAAKVFARRLDVVRSTLRASSTSEVSAWSSVLRCVTEAVAAVAAAMKQTSMSWKKETSQLNLPSSSTMGIQPFWASAVSVLFRIAVWTYLRLLPFHKALGPIIVVTLVLYYLALFFQDASHPAVTESVGVHKGNIVDVKITEDSNGIPGKGRNVSAEVVVAAPVDSQPSVRIIITYSYILDNLRLALRPTCYFGTLSPDTLQEAFSCVSCYQHSSHRTLHRLYVHTLS